MAKTKAKSKAIAKIKKPLSLAKSEILRRQIAEAKTINDIKPIHDQLVAMGFFAKKQKLDMESQNDIAEMVIDSQVRGGKILKAAARRGRPVKGSAVEPFTLEGAGVSKQQSYRWQLAAEAEPSEVERYFKERRSKDEPITSAGVQRIARLAKINAELDKIHEAESKAPTGNYGTIIIDPPWPMQKIEREARPNQLKFDYDTMTEPELELLEIPIAASAHVWVWTTHRFMPMAFRLLSSWGLKYVCTFVWHKPGGFQPIGLPQYNCEFALYCRKGTPKFTTTKSFSTCFNAPRREHSEKPEIFYDMVRRVTRGRRLDMFNRREIEGFDGHGRQAK